MMVVVVVVISEPGYIAMMKVPMKRRIKNPMQEKHHVKQDGPICKSKPVLEGIALRTSELLRPTFSPNFSSLEHFSFDKIKSPFLFIIICF